MATSAARTGSRRALVQTAALAVGVVFLLVGVLGFIPGITADYDTMTFAGHESEAKLLGIFQVSVLHNLLHLAVGVLGVLASRATAAARMFLLVGGVAYLGLWIYGMVVPETSSANFVPLNTADDWLHLVLGLGMVLLGLVMPRRQSNATAATYAGPTAGGDIQ